MNPTCLLLCAVLSVTSQAIFAQRVEITANEVGNYEIFDVISVDSSFTKEQLYQNALDFVKKEIRQHHKRKAVVLSQSADSGKVIGLGSLLIFRKGLVTPQPEGEVFYQLTIETKDGRYRYTFSHFFINMYQRDRYGVYKPINRIKKPLEPFLNDEDNKYRAYQKADIAQHLDYRINLLKMYMLKKSNAVSTDKTEKRVQKAKSENW